MAPPRFDINDPYLMTLEKKKKLQKLPEHYPLVAWRIIRSAEEWSKVMAYFYYGAAKPSCLNSMAYSQENIPSIVTDNPVS
ncbi:hypothetical protein JHK87_029442 [Glycine soja]|nr:hypothetical protein JHK87_029442 [Glycine soja]